MSSSLSKLKAMKETKVATTMFTTRTTILQMSKMNAGFKKKVKATMDAKLYGIDWKGEHLWSNRVLNLVA
jgi:predicted glycosyl hydrolase (DUF1957 family)